jgi:hypothetical protein
MICGSSPGRGWEFTSSPRRPDRLWGPPSLLSSGHQTFFLLGYSGRGVNLAIHLHGVVLSLKKVSKISSEKCICVCVLFIIFWASLLQLSRKDVKNRVKRKAKFCNFRKPSHFPLILMKVWLNKYFIKNIYFT